MKICQTCKLPNKVYGVSRLSKDGLNPVCKDCLAACRAKYADRNRARAAAWYEQNKDKARSAMSRRRSENKPAAADRDAAYYRKHASTIIARNAAWRAKNPSKAKAIRTSPNAKAYAKAYRKNNPLVMRAHNAIKKARRRNAAGTHSANDLRQLFILQRGKCPSCEASLAHSYHVDHVQPLSRGGRNDRHNLQLLCVDCNLAKHCKDPVTFMRSRGFLI